MSHKYLFDARFHAFLFNIDKEFFIQAQKKGCPHCKGVLHKADYLRSPIGTPPKYRHQYNSRFSLCCRDCRKRVTPPSVRFFGRRWFPAPFFIFISLLKLGINERRLRQVKHHFGITVSKRTWQRWRVWWQECFTSTSFWQYEKGKIRTDILLSIYPKDLLTIFSGNLKEKLLLLLHFLSPITAGFFRAV